MTSPKSESSIRIYTRASKRSFNSNLKFEDEHFDELTEERVTQH